MSYSFVIDLGPLAREPEVEDAFAAGSPRVRAGPVLGAVLFAIVVLLGGSSATVVPRPPHPVTISVGVPAWFTLDGATVYAARGSAGLTAYDLPWLRARWTAPLVITSTVRVSVPAGPTGPARDVVTIAPLAPRSEVVGLDVTTGTERWRAQGYPLWRSPDGRVIVLASSGPPDRTDGSREPRRVQGLDATTGRNLWTHTISSVRGEDLKIVYGQRDRAPLVAALVSSPESGTQLVNFSTGLARPLPGLPAPSAVRLHDDLLLVAPAGQVDSVLAYDAATLRLRWAVADVAMRTSSSCGDLLCLHSGAATVAVDRVSGSVRWRADWASVSGHRDRVVATRTRSSGSGDIAVVAAESGRTLLELPGWRTLASGDRLVPMLHRDLGGTAKLATLDVEALTVREIGELPGDGASCQASDVMIGCVVGQGELTVWRYA